jgi:hypothetical protein
MKIKRKSQTPLCIRFFKVINKLISYYSTNTTIDKIETLHAIYEQIIDVPRSHLKVNPKRITNNGCFGKSRFRF